MPADEVQEMLHGGYRKIYQCAIRGKRINSVGMEAEAFFWRLHLVADDFGAFDADPLILLSGTMPRRKTITEEQVVNWLAELSEVGLIQLYNVGDDNLGRIIDFEKMQTPANGRRRQSYPFPAVAPTGFPGSPRIPGIPPDSRDCRKVESPGICATRPDQTRPDQTIPNQTSSRPDQTRPDSAAAAVLDELKAAGIGEPMLSTLAETPGLTPVHVAMLAEQVKTVKAEKPVGLLITKIRSEELPRTVPPKFLCQLARNGRLAKVCGIEVQGKQLGQNPKFLQIGDLKIEAKRITPESVELARAP